VKLLGDPMKRDFDEEPIVRERKSPVAGFVILGSIVVICLVLAYYLSTFMESGEEQEENVVIPRLNPEMTAEEEATETPSELHEMIHEPPPNITREGIEAVNAQVRGLGEISDAVMSFRLAEDRYPIDMEELIRFTELELPENPYDPEVPMREVAPGDFYPGGFSYLPFYSRREGPIEGFVLIGYTDDPTGGTLIDRPADLVWPYIFDPPIESPMPGVSVVMGEGRQLIDISDFTDTSQESENQL
jgi:hypothetical protein